MTGTQGRAPAGPLDDAQIEAFRETGFVLVRGLIGGDALAALREWVGEVESWPEIRGAHMMYFEESRLAPGVRVLNRVENVVPYHEGLRALMAGPELAGSVGQLFGEPAVLFKDKINFKLPGGDGFAAHQDVQAGWDRYAGLHITAMVSVDETTVANGCLEIAPGAHGRGLLGESWRPLTDEDLPPGAYRPVETAPGDAVFFDSYAPHRSAPNDTGQPRRVLYFTYNRASEGDHLARYYADKRASYPPDIERDPDRQYVFRV
jgi:ectoine hydroxylase-related dioxygenase (phytanoyl-CoA dioxygenase family)